MLLIIRHLNPCGRCDKTVYSASEATVLNMAFEFAVTGSSIAYNLEANQCRSLVPMCYIN